MKRNNICVLFICLSVLAVFIDYNEAFPAPDVNAGADLNDEKAVRKAQTTHIGEVFRNLPSGELIRFYKGVPNSDIENVYSGIPREFIRYILLVLQQAKPKDINKDAPTITKIPDDQLPGVVANLDATAKKDLTRLMNSAENGQLLLRFSQADINKLQDVITPEEKQKFIGVAPTANIPAANIPAANNPAAYRPAANKPAVVAPKPAPKKAGNGGLGNLLGADGLVGGLLGGGGGGKGGGLLGGGKGGGLLAGLLQ